MKNISFGLRSSGDEKPGRFVAEPALGAVIVLFLISFMLALFLKGGYLALDGADTLCHLYRAQEVRANLSQGILYPLYDPKWYNGVEFMRYWGPVPLYLLSLIQWICGGNTPDSYPVFLSQVLFFGSCGWLCFGIQYKRVGCALTIALVWFFSPENIRICTTDGNVPRIVINALLPWFLYTVWQVAEEKRVSQLPWAMVIFLFILLSHLGIALIVLFSVMVALLFHGISRKEYRPQGMLATSFLLVFLSAGLWLVPAMFGGAITNSNTNQVMQYFFQSIWTSLSPVKRMNGDMLTFYYGISFAFLGLVGAFLSHKKTRLLFVVGILLFLFTGEVAYGLFSQLPFSQFLWMIRFVPMSAALILMGFLLWDSLKKPLVLAFCFLLVLDCLPSVSYLIHLREVNLSSNRINMREVDWSSNWIKQREANPASSYDLVEQSARIKGLKEAKAITRQRMSVMDLSAYGSFAPYYIAGAVPKVQYAFGAGWEGAATGSNLVRLNSALELGHYRYLFDRSLELGIDVVSVPLSVLKRPGDSQRMELAGGQAGYQLTTRAEEHLIFQHPVPGAFGTVTDYPNLAIGASARDIALVFPDFEEGNSDRLEDYTLEELAKYQIIYLSGFSYEKRAEAEQMLNALAAQGVTIIIDMNQIPLDRETGSHQLFRVFAQPISFNEGFPVLEYDGKRYEPEGFPPNYSAWNTVYLDGVSQIKGRCEFQNRQVIFAGTAENPQIYFLGLNMIYLGIQTGDPEAIRMVEAIFGEPYGTLPKREVVPISIRFSGKEIRIDSPRAGVNTSLAWLDIFYTEQEIEKRHNLLVVPQGRTDLQLRYPYLLDGLVISLCGLVLSGLFLRRMKYLFRLGILWRKSG